MTVDVLILAAGRGSRLGRLTDDRPKCLMELAGRPLIKIQLATLRAAGLKRIEVVTGYSAHCLERLGVPLIHNPRWRDTNMIASLLCADKRLRSANDLVVSYGDIVFERRVIEALLATRGDIATVIDLGWRRLWEARSDDPLSDAESLKLAADGAVTEIGRKAASLDEIEGQYIGLTKFTAAGKRALLDLVARAGDDWPLPRPLDQTHFTDMLNGLIEAGARVEAAKVTGGWLEIDTPRDLEVYERLRARGELGRFFVLEDHAVPAS
jgi:choline kinase